MNVKAFFTFLKYPHDFDIKEPGLFDNFKIIVYWFLMYYGFAIILILVQGFLKMKDLLPEHSNSYKELPLTFSIIVIVPICEELLFRLILKYSKINLSLFISTIAYFVFHILFQLSRIYALVSSVMVFMIFSYALFRLDLDGKLESFWKKNIAILFYVSSLAFGLVHLTNFVGIKPIHLLFIPIIVGNQLVLGLVFGFLRIKLKNGIIVTMLLHILINFPALLLSNI